MRFSTAAGEESKASPWLTGMVVLRPLRRLESVGGCGNLGAVGICGGEEDADGAVGVLEVELRDARDVFGGDGFELLVVEEVETPVAAGDDAGEAHAHLLGVVHGLFHLAENAGLDAFDFVFGGRLGGHAGDGFEHGFAHVVEGLVVGESGGGQDEAGVVHFVEANAGGEGLLVVDEGFGETSGAVAAVQNAGEDFEGGRVGVGHGGAVLGDHDLLALADAAEFDVAFAILRGLDGVGGVELAGGAREWRRRSAAT